MLCGGDRIGRSRRGLTAIEVIAAVVVLVGLVAIGLFAMRSRLEGQRLQGLVRERPGELFEVVYRPLPWLASTPTWSEGSTIEIEFEIRNKTSHGLGLALNGCGFILEIENVDTQSRVLVLPIVPTWAGTKWLQDADVPADLRPSDDGKWLTIDVPPRNVSGQVMWLLVPTTRFTVWNASSLPPDPFSGSTTTKRSLPTGDYTARIYISTAYPPLEPDRIFDLDNPTVIRSEPFRFRVVPVPESGEGEGEID